MMKSTIYIYLYQVLPFHIDKPAIPSYLLFLLIKAKDIIICIDSERDHTNNGLESLPDMMKGND